MFGYAKKRKDIYSVSTREELRYKYKIKRKYFQHSAREVADGAICDTLLSAMSGYDSFFIYYSFGAEADTHAIIDKLLSLGKRVYLPKVEGENMLAVRYFGNENELTKNRFGIAEPTGQAVEEEIQVCIAPLLAVNYQGYRLGYGGGYYDRFFANHKSILKIGLGYFLQYSEDFFPDIWDEPLDKFICERGIIDFGKRI